MRPDTPLNRKARLMMTGSLLPPLLRDSRFKMRSSIAIRFLLFLFSSKTRDFRLHLLLVVSIRLYSTTELVFGEENPYRRSTHNLRSLCNTQYVGVRCSYNYVSVLYSNDKVGNLSGFTSYVNRILGVDFRQLASESVNRTFSCIKPRKVADFWPSHRNATSFIHHWPRTSACF